VIKVDPIPVTREKTGKTFTVELSVDNADNALVLYMGAHVRVQTVSGAAPPARN
jgi:hypothetical protein